MGTLVEKIAKERGHEISCVIDAGDSALYLSPEFRESDVAIQFVVPEAAVESILNCFYARVPVVTGTTGWYDALPQVRQMCEKTDGSLLYASNFSIGMNIFMEINRRLSRIMNRVDSYRPRLSEVHHIHKLDHPSGTAITLAQDLIKECERITCWEETGEEMFFDAGTLPVYHERKGEVPGIHTVAWESDCDTLSITHSAKNRNGFALGAVCAAEWLAGKKGFFTMSDFLQDVTAF